MKLNREENIVSRWLKYADEDLSIARYLHKGRKYRGAFCFCQESAEKALKAMILHKKKKFTRVSDLGVLVRESILDESMTKDWERLFHTDAKYPDARIKSYTKIESEEGVKIAEEIVKWVRDNLS